MHVECMMLDVGYLLDNSANVVFVKGPKVRNTLSYGIKALPCILHVYIVTADI